MESPIKKARLSIADTLREGDIAAHENATLYVKPITKIFKDNGIEPDYPCHISIAYCPDIVSLDFEKRPYTENCDDMEGYIRCNLFHLLHQSDNILSKHKTFSNGGAMQADIFIYTLPVVVLSDRLCVRLEASVVKTYKALLKLQLIYMRFFHYFHHICTANKSGTADADTNLLLKTLAYACTYKQLCNNGFEAAVFKLLTEKVFRRLPLSFLRDVPEDRIIAELIHCAAEDKTNLGNLFQRLQIDAYEMFINN